MPVLRTDILPEELTTEKARIIVKNQIDSIIDSSPVSARPRLSAAAQSDRLRSAGSAKDIYDFCDLVDQAISHRQNVQKIAEDARVILTQETADVDQRLEAITFHLEKRSPGQFSEGSPFSGDVRNFRPIVREVLADPDNPGYRKIYLGYWYDNLVNFTCWARTNKEANKRSLWFEQLMEDYRWSMELQGISRILFWDRGPDVERTVDTTSTNQSSTNKYYGRPMLYYVRTERITTVSEKELEQLIVKLHISTADAAQQLEE